MVAAIGGGGGGVVTMGTNYSNTLGNFILKKETSSKIIQQCRPAALRKTSLYSYLTAIVWLELSLFPPDGLSLSHPDTFGNSPRLLLPTC